MSRHYTTRLRVRFSFSYAASSDSLASVDARELVLQRLYEEVLDHRIKLLGKRLASLMEARRYDDARRYCAGARELALSRSPSHMRRLELPRGLTRAVGQSAEAADPSIGLAHCQEASHA